MMWIPVMYICILQQCEFLQQQTVYTNKELCKMVIAEKVEWYKKNTHAQVDGTCIDVFIEVKDAPIKPKL